MLTSPWSLLLPQLPPPLPHVLVVFPSQHERKAEEENKLGAEGEMVWGSSVEWATSLF